MFCIRVFKCVSAKLQQAGIALEYDRVGWWECFNFSILERRVERLNNLMNNVEKKLEANFVKITKCYEFG